jgi:hypothetical protein
VATSLKVFLKIFTGLNCYCLISHSGEICDIAGKFSISELFQLKKFIWDNFDLISMDCRKNSQKLIRKLGGKIIQEKKYKINGENMVFYKINLL